MAVAMQEVGQGAALDVAAVAGVKIDDLKDDGIEVLSVLSLES